MESNLEIERDLCQRFVVLMSFEAVWKFRQASEANEDLTTVSNFATEISGSDKR